MSDDKVYGIDLGTTYSAIALVNDLEIPEIIQNSEGNQTTPSVVLFEDEQSVTVGEVAKRSAASDPDETSLLIKRHMGTDYTQVYQNETYTPEAISSLILKSLVQGANASMGLDADQVVITVPAYFGSQEREATKQAGQIADLDVIGIVTEPVAAALSIGIDSTANETIMVYDLGGGTFDTTIMRLAQNNVEVLAVEGDRELGGADWDEVLLQIVVDKFIEETGIDDDPLSDPEFEIELRLEVEDAKKSLTGRSKSLPIRLNYEGAKASITVTQEEFEEATKHLVERTLEITDRCIEVAKGKDPNLSLDRILLVGGSSRMPMIPAAIKERFGVEAQPTEYDLAVAKGAAIYGKRVLSGEVITNVGTSESTAGGDEGGPFLSPSGKPATVITNVLSRSVGLQFYDPDEDKHYIGFFAHSNDQIPLSTTSTARTLEDGQESVLVSIYEQAGDRESETPEDNRLLKERELDIPVPNLPKGSPVEIEFSISSEGLITVVCTEPKSGNSITVEAAVSILTEEQVAEEKKKVSNLMVQD